MKYEKIEIEVIQFDSFEFIAGSLDDKGHCEGYRFGGHTCGVYDQGENCNGYTWDNTRRDCESFDGTRCGVFTGISGTTYYNFTPGQGWYYFYTCDGFACTNGF